jgi:hypothetical protein
MSGSLDEVDEPDVMRQMRNPEPCETRHSVNGNSEPTTSKEVQTG